MLTVTFSPGFASFVSIEYFAWLAKALTESNTVVIIVDELDRCIPEYAIKVLERLHHLTEEKENPEPVEETGFRVLWLATAPDKMRPRASHGNHREKESVFSVTCSEIASYLLFLALQATE